MSNVASHFTYIWNIKVLRPQYFHADGWIGDTLNKGEQFDFSHSTTLWDWLETPYG